MSVYITLRFEYGGLKGFATKLNHNWDRDKLDAIAKRKKVTPLSEFIAAEVEADEALAPLQEDISEKEFGSGEIDGKEGDRRNRLLDKLAAVHGRWFTADDGLRTIAALLAAFKPGDPDSPADNLLELRDGIEAAKKKNRRFRMHSG